jgi:hypothetical protein
VIQETVTKRVPVVGRHVVIEFFPEGGNLVAGVPCRVYFRATTPTGQPVDIKGTLTDGRRTIAKLETLTDAAEGANRGIGSFTYTPVLDTPVWLKLDSPQGMYAPVIVPNERSFPVAASAVAGLPAAGTARTGFMLPNPKSEGVVMTVLDPVTAPGQPVRVHMRSVGATRKLVVGAYTRGRLSDTKTVTAEPNQVTEVVLMANADPRGGVVRITVFEMPMDEAEGEDGLKPDMRPIAERLVFRKPGEALNLSFTTPPGRKAGDATELGITAKDEKGNAAAAILYAAAVNTGVAPGPKDRLLTTHFLIAGEINTPDAMEYADFLLTDHPKAGEVLDLVLATQGWRRFAEQTQPGYTKSPTAPSAECANLLVTNGQYTVWTDPAAIRDRRKLHETYWPQYESAKKARDDARSALAAANADRTAELRALELAASIDSARDETKALVERADAAAQPVARFQKAAWFGVAGFGLLAILLFAVGFVRPTTRLPLGIGTVGSLGLVAFLVFALGLAEQTRAAASVGPEPPRTSVAAADKSIDTAPMPAETAANAKDMAASTDFDKGRPLLAKGKSSFAPGGKGGFGGLEGFAPPGTAAPPTGGMPATGPKEFRHPSPYANLPKIDPGRGGGAASLGGAGGGRPAGDAALTQQNMGFGEYGFFHRWMSHLKATPPAPAPGSAPGVTTVAPPLAPGGGGPAAGAVERIDRTSKTVIPVEDVRPSRGPEPSVASGTGLVRTAPSTGTDILAGGGSGADVKRRAEAFRLELDRHAKDFAFNRAKLASEALLETLARKQSVPTEVLLKALEVANQGAGWSPKPGQPATQLSIATDVAKAFIRLEQSLPKVPPLVVREYAAPRPGAGDDEFISPDTVLWQPVIVLPSDGQAKIPFYLGNAPGGYEVVIAGHTLDGRIGAVRRIIPVGPPETMRQDAIPSPGTPVPPPKP